MKGLLLASTLSLNCVIMIFHCIGYRLIITTGLEKSPIWYTVVQDKKLFLLGKQL